MLRQIFTVQLFFLSFLMLYSQQKVVEPSQKNDLVKSYLVASEQLKSIKKKYENLSEDIESKNKTEQIGLLKNVYLISEENILISKKLIDYIRIKRLNSSLILKVKETSTSFLNEGNEILESINNLIYDKNKRRKDKKKNKILFDSVQKLNRINDRLSNLNLQVTKKSSREDVIKSFREVN